MKNKLAVSTLAFQGWEAEDALRVCGESGIDAMEIRMGFHSWSELSLPDKHYKELRKQMENRGIETSDLGTGIRLIGYRKEALEELKRLSQIAEILQCKGLRIMLGNRHKRRSDVVPDIDMEGMVRWLSEADEILRDWGTEIWIETHDEFATGKAQRELLNRGSFRHIRLLWDIMHPLEAGEAPEETLRYMGTDLAHVHIKDGRPWADPDLSSWKYTRLGEGAVPIEFIIRNILNTGYDGYFSLEWESAWRAEIRGENFPIPEILQDFAGRMRSIV